MISKPIPYGRQCITDGDIQAVIETLKSDYLTQGPKIKEFEAAFAEYVGAKYAVAVNNATSGLHLSATALDVRPGDKVIVTPMTFAASANCIRYCGGEVVFCDIDKDTYLMDIHKLESLLQLSPKGTYKGIVPVDFAGYPLQMETFRRLADEYGLWIIEDACHAPGGYFVDGNGQKQYCGNGSFADVSVFSFHPVKHIATGEGGMVTTNNKELYDRLCLYRTHGITKNPDLLQEHHGGWYYEMQEAVLLRQLLAQVLGPDIGIAVGQRSLLANGLGGLGGGAEGVFVGGQLQQLGHAGPHALGLLVRTHHIGRGFLHKFTDQILNRHFLFLHKVIGCPVGTRYP